MTEAFATRAELLTERSERIAEIERRRFGWTRDLLTPFDTETTASRPARRAQTSGAGTVLDPPGRRVAVEVMAGRSRSDPSRTTSSR